MQNDFTFFIYDYESFGVNPATDRPAQFAGIRTDADFNIIGEPIMFYCKQTNDYLPAPDAVLVTGITPQQCNELGLAEPEFAEAILTEFSRPNTCVMGYNNIRYDDEMTRYTFYRNFIDPYEYSWKNGNSRWDLLDLVRACYALRPEGINWAYDEDGMPSFRLEKLTKANGIEHENAHDAMSDVYATIAMAKLIKKKHQNAVIVCDLSANIDDLLNKSAVELRDNLYTKKSDLEQKGVLPVPLKLVHINKCPIIAPAKTLLAENAARLGIDRELCLQNLAKLRNSVDIRNKVEEIFKEERQFEPNDNDNVETELYAGFFSNNDKNNLAILRQLPPEKLSEHGLTFEDKRIPELLFHYRARHFYKMLTRTEQLKWDKYRRRKLEQSAVKFSEDLQRLGEENVNNPENLALLQKVYEYGTKLLNLV